MNQPSLIDLLLSQQRQGYAPRVGASVDPLEGKGAQAQLTPQQQAMVQQFQQMQQQPLDLSYQSSDNDMFNRAMSGELDESTKAAQDWLGGLKGGK